MPYGQEKAVILPPGNQEQTMQWAIGYQDREKQQKLLQQKQQQKNLDDMAKYAVDQLDVSKQLTGTSADPIISQTAAAALAKHSQTILSGNVGASLIFDIQRDVGKIVDYSNKIKNIVSYADKFSKPFEKDGNVDSNRLRNAIINEAILERKEDGSFGVKDADDIDDTKDYGTEILTKQPKRVVTATAGLMNTFSDLRKAADDVGDIYTVENNKGITIKKKYRGKLMAYQKIADQGGNKVAQVKTDKIGQVEVLHDDAYQLIFGRKPSNIFLLNARVQEQFPDIDLNSEEAEVMRRKIALDTVKAVDGDTNPIINEYDRDVSGNAERSLNPPPIRVSVRVGDGSGGDTKVTSSNIGEFIENQNRIKDGRVDVTPLFGNYKMKMSYNDKDGKNVEVRAAQMLYNKQSRQVEMTLEDGTPKSYSPADFEKLFYRTSNLNAKEDRVTMKAFIDHMRNPNSTKKTKADEEHEIKTEAERRVNRKEVGTQLGKQAALPWWKNIVPTWMKN